MGLWHLGSGEGCSCDNSERLEWAGSRRHIVPSLPNRQPCHGVGAREATGGSNAMVGVGAVEPRFHVDIEALEACIWVVAIVGCRVERHD